MDAQIVVVAASLAVVLLASIRLKVYRDRLKNLDEPSTFDKVEFVAYRAEVLQAMSRLSGEDLARTARLNDPYNADLRQSCIDIMDRHEFICSMYNRNLIEEDVFDEYLRDMIIADHESFAEFLELVHEDQLARGLREQWPLYPEITRMRTGGVAPADPSGISSSR